MAKPRYETLPSDSPIWASEPFRVFFPLGVVAAVFGLILWPIHYFGWWPIYPALQHPRLLIFGFGAAFVFGFLGTAWPRFLEAEALSRLEVIFLATLWCLAQFSYAQASIGRGDAIMALSFLTLLGVLLRRLIGKDRELPPPGFALAALAVLLGLLVTFAWSMSWHLQSPELDHLLRLLGYQGFLVLPLIGVGSYLFPRVFREKGVDSRRRALTVWISAAVILLSFFVEVYVSGQFGNGLRLAAVMAWAYGAIPMVFRWKAGGTRPWVLQVGIGLICCGFLSRVIWPHETFAFEHFLFLGGFSLMILLVADRVVDGHCDASDASGPISKRWRWFTWLIILTVATRATADLVPSTRISHHIYAAVMLVIVLLLWIWGVCHVVRQKHPD